MRPISLTLENFGSYRGVHEVDFSGISLAVFTGPNGSGKTTLACDAPLFALFGETRGDANTAISEGESMCRVEFRFALGAQVCLVSRQRSRKGNGSTALHFEVDGQVLDGKTVGDTAKRIEDVLHMDCALLRMTAFSMQGQADLFSQAKPAERKGVLGQILNLQRYDRLAELAREGSRTEQATLERMALEIQGLLTEAERAPEIEVQIAANAERIALLDRDREGLRGDLVTAQQQRASAVAEQESAETKRRELAEAAAQLKQSEGAVAEREARLRKLEQATAWRPSIAKELEAATAAAQRADELLAARDQDQQLAHEEQGLRQRIDSAAAQRKLEMSGLRDAIAAAKRDHHHKIDQAEGDARYIREKHGEQVRQLEADYSRLAKQSELLKSARCAALDPKVFPIAEQLVADCPLIADAREAEAQIAGVMEQLNEARAATPWAQKQGDLEALRAAEANVGAQERARLAELEQLGADVALEAERAAVGQKRATLGYVAGAWEKAKAEADKRPALETRMRELETAAAQASEVQAGIEELRARVTELSALVERLRSELGDTAEIAKRLTDIDSEIRRCEAATGVVEREAARAQAEAGRLEQQLKVAREAAERAAALQGEVAGHEKRRQLLELLGNPRSGAFSRSGIPALLIDAAIPDLEATANDMLHTLSDGKMGLQIRTQRETGERTMTETLDIVVINDRGERPYETYSGGERTRVDLALRAGLAQLLARRAGARCELLVIDEPEGLDEEGQDELVECLNRLSGHFATILLMTHIERLKDALPVRIAVSKPNGGSRVEVLR